jgi:3-hydroxy-9,10-secoandrosta-1,3,5(10)-triene-9,17-dione monooxygenase reductase component
MADGSDPTPLARAIACIPTGLYVVTTLADGKPVGFVASFLMQVGFSPPTLCVAVAKERGPLAPMRASGRFTVSVLDGGSSSLMGAFFRKYPAGESAFDHVEHVEAPSGLPVLSRALSWLDCRASGEHETGDHVVLFGTVEHGGLLREGDPAIHLRKNGLDY